MQSVVVKNTMGNLGNKMFTYIVLYILRVKYGLDVYVTENVVLHLREYFENVSEFPIAERSLCGFKRFQREFSKKQWSNILSFSREEMKERKNQTKDFFGKGKSETLTSVLNSIEVYGIKNEMDDNLQTLTSFPWEDFSGDMRKLEKQAVKSGKAFLFFPMGMTMEAFDDTFGEMLNYQMDDVPGILDFTINAFSFKKVLRETSDDNLRTIGEHFKKNNMKKFKKRQEITYVGVHNRRGDHIDFQKESGYKSLEPGYFIEAMDMYREKYKRVVFIYVSDDMDWGRGKLKKRTKTNDLYLAGSLQNKELAKTPIVSAAYDLALLSACNHTITSYGTYSFWAGALAGRGRGKRVTPAFFMKYRNVEQTSMHYNIHPFKSKLPKFYYGMRFMR